MGGRKSACSWILPFVFGWTICPACSPRVLGPNRPPVANAGNDQELPVRVPAELYGTNSLDPDGDRVTYNWELVAMPPGGDPHVLVGRDTSNARLTPDRTGVWMVRLVVADGQLDSEPDVVRVVAAGCRLDSDCDDSDFCDGQETCLDGRCRAGPPTACDDGDICTQDRCELGSCVHDPQPDGMACDDGPGANGNVCDSSCLSGKCADLVPADAGQACDDQVACTSGDSCDGHNLCVGTPDSGVCSGGLICMPQCAPDPDGCVEGPASMDLTCEDPVALSEMQVSTCTITLGGDDRERQENCLACSARVGLVEVERADFANDFGRCSPDGWSLMPGSGDLLCTVNVDDCTPGPEPAMCIDDFDCICETSSFGQPVLKVDESTGCGGDHEQFRLFKEFDLSGLLGVQVCFDLAEDGATSDEGVLVYASDGSDRRQQIFCLNGASRPGVDQVFYQTCLDLPSWAQGHPSVSLFFLVHSNSSDDSVYLDNISVRGWSAGCDGIQAAALSDDLTQCALDNWTITGSYECPGSDMDCPDYPEWGPGLKAHWDQSSEMTTRLDASHLDDDLELCVRLGYKLNDSELTISLDAGSGFSPVWFWEASQITDTECEEVCINLSALDPRVNNNPDLGIRIRQESHESHSIVYGVAVRGKQYCPVDTGEVTLSGPPLATGSGQYEFTATNNLDIRLKARVDCCWSPDPSMQARSDVTWTP